MKKYDTIIVGGGPSGMTAALWCARDGQRVLLMDRCDRIGKKILVTGNGKCNLTNFRQSPDCYRSETPRQRRRCCLLSGRKTPWNYSAASAS